VKLGLDGTLVLGEPRVDVGKIGGDAGRHLDTLGNGPVAGHQDLDVPCGFAQPAHGR
jgi:hypothetical protein